MRILILGPSGQIGYELASYATAIADVVTAGRTAADVSLDPLDNSALDNLFSNVQPDIVINAIAYTSVDKAESEQQLAFNLNADLPAALADRCATFNCLLIHYSTDFVFDGIGNRPWSEASVTHPLNVYGKSKLAGEKAIKMSDCSSLILRTSWVYGDRGSNFLLSMLRLAKANKSLSIVDDQWGSPSCSRDIAQATISLCQRYFAGVDFVKSRHDLYHLTARGETSWYGFAKSIFELAAQHESLSIQELIPISASEYQSEALRPAYSVLNCQGIKDKFDIELPDWKVSLERCINDYYR